METIHANKDKINFKKYNNINNLDITSKENEETDINLKTGIHNKKIKEEKNIINQSNFDDSNAVFNLNETFKNNSN